MARYEAAALLIESESGSSFESGDSSEVQSEDSDIVLSEESSGGSEQSFHSTKRAHSVVERETSKRKSMLKTPSSHGLLNQQSEEAKREDLLKLEKRNSKVRVSSESSGSVAMENLGFSQAASIVMAI